MRSVIIAVGAPREGDARPGGNQQLRLGTAAGGDEFAAVDHRRGQRAMVHHRTGARTPGRAGSRLVALRRIVAAELEGIAALDQRNPLRGQTLEFDGADLGAVLLKLRAPLRLLVGIEIPGDPVDLAMEHIDERPQQLIEVVFEAGVGQHGGETVDDFAKMRLHSSRSGSGRGSGSSRLGR